MDSRAKLKELIMDKAIKWGKFKLAYGGESDYYFDAKQIINDPEVGSYISEIIYDKIKDNRIDCIGAQIYGAIPIAFNLSNYIYYKHNKNIPVVAVRKEVKEHGTRKHIEGSIENHKRIVVVDDVVTTGTSMFDAIKRLEEAGLEVVMVISLVDREVSGRECFKDYDYQPLFSMNELLELGETEKKKSLT